MVMIAAAPLATADTHHVVKGAQGPRASAVTWEYVPVEFGTWYGHIVNTGLRSLVVDVFDNSTGVLEDVMHQRIRFAAYPSSTVDTMGAVMNPTHKYVITVTPNGPRDSYCDVEDKFVPAIPPVAVISVTSQISLTVAVSGSGSSDLDGTIMSYGWAFGDGAVATGETATHTYASAGTYDITLVVVDNDGLTGTDVETVTVSKDLIKPVAIFTPTMSFMTVSVDATASYDPDGVALTYAWNFGDATTGVGKTATHTYAAAGDYLITLVVTDVDMLTDSASASVTAVKPVPPVAAFMATPTYLSVAVDASGSYDPDGTIKSYAWTFGDGGVATGKTATHSYAADGTYTITLTVTDMQDLTATKTEPVTVKHQLIPPVALFTATPNLMTVSVDASASYDPDAALWGPIASYSWDFGDMTTGSGKTTTHTYSAEGLYMINLVVTDADLLTASATPKEVSAVQPDLPPTASFTATPSGLTVNVDASLSGDDKGIVSYTWAWGDGVIETVYTANAMHTYAIPAPAPRPIVSAPVIAAAGPPVTPYLLYGYTTDALGTPYECYVTITILRTGEVVNTNSFQVDPWPLDGYYEWDLANNLALGYLPGDLIKVDAVSVSGTMSGSVTAAVPGGGAMPVDVTLTSSVPHGTFIKTITLTVTDIKGQTSTISHDVELTY